MKILITQDYNSEFATVNGAWAAARQHGYVADRVYVLCSSRDAARRARLRAMLEQLQRTHGVDPFVDLLDVATQDAAAIQRAAGDIIRGTRALSGSVAVDLTPGRTVPKLALLRACLLERPDHLFYLDVPDFDYRWASFVKIPFRLQRCRDLALEERFGG
ncbi:MAG: hypothetical protein ACYDDF_00915 [Thermoplasmatota archaeon]